MGVALIPGPFAHSPSSRCSSDGGWMYLGSASAPQHLVGAGWEAGHLRIGPKNEQHHNNPAKVGELRLSVGVAWQAWEEVRGRDLLGYRE